MNFTQSDLGNGRGRGRGRAFGTVFRIKEDK